MIRTLTAAGAVLLRLFFPAVGVLIAVLLIISGVHFVQDGDEAVAGWLIITLSVAIAGLSVTAAVFFNSRRGKNSLSVYSPDAAIERAKQHGDETPPSI